MAKASKKNKGPKYDTNLEYVLQTPPANPDVKPNVPGQQPRLVRYVCQQTPVKDDPDFSKALKYKGGWLSETVWEFELFWKAVPYFEAKKIADTFKPKPKHETPPPDNRRQKQSRNTARPNLRKGKSPAPARLPANKGGRKKSPRR